MAGPLSLALFSSPLATAPRAKRVTDLAPRMAPAAVRVPLPVHSALPLVFPRIRPQVFVHEGARQALERRFSQAFGGPVSLGVNDNIRSVVTIKKSAGHLRVSLHHMFLDASAAMKDALVRYAVHNDRDASQTVSRFIHESQHRLRASRPPLRPLVTKGAAHDLLALFRGLNERYFGGHHDALVTWGRTQPSRRKNPRKAIKLGSYSAVERLIRVHPVLDRKWVPRYFVEYILFHEMLHHVVPPTKEGGLHNDAFLDRERTFRHYDRAIRWERAHLGRLLRA